MKYAKLGASDLESSRLVYGCMRLADNPATATQALSAALDAGCNHFDHADIYGGGASETLFGEFLRAEPGLRDRLILTSKCGVRRDGTPAPASPKRYDLSARWIESSVDGSLSRLGTGHLDLFLLHRPDLLLDADEIAAAFERLHAAGKVRYFGVSNFSPSQLELLQSRLDRPLIANQVEISLAELAVFGDGTLDQCQRRGIVPLAWSPLKGVVGNALDARTRARVDAELERQAGKHGCDRTAVALAWLLFHPAGIVPIIGTTNPARIGAATAAVDIDYGRDDWYRLLEARTGSPVP